MKSVGYVSIAHAHGYVLLVSFMLQIVTGIVVIMVYRVTDDEFMQLCLLIVGSVFN